MDADANVLNFPNTVSTRFFTAPEFERLTQTALRDLLMYGTLIHWALWYLVRHRCYGRFGHMDRARIYLTKYQSAQCINVPYMSRSRSAV